MPGIASKKINLILLLIRLTGNKPVYLFLLNPLLHNGNYSYRIIKISFSKKEGIKKKFPISAASMSR